MTLKSAFLASSICWTTNLANVLPERMKSPGWKLYILMTLSFLPGKNKSIAIKRLLWRWILCIYFETNGATIRPTPPEESRGSKLQYALYLSSGWCEEMNDWNINLAFESLSLVSCKPIMENFSLTKSSRISSNLQGSLMPLTLSEAKEMVCDESLRQGEFWEGENLGLMKLGTGFAGGETWRIWRLWLLRALLIIELLFFIVSIISMVIINRTGKITLDECGCRC